MSKPETLLTTVPKCGNNVDMQNTTNTPTLTATREHTSRGPVVVLYADGVEIGRAGGKRAERAVAVIACCWNPTSTVVRKWETPGIYGVRADMAKAEAEAANLTVSRPITHGRSRTILRGNDGRPLMTNAAAWAVAVPVEG